MNCKCKYVLPALNEDCCSQVREALNCVNKYFLFIEKLCPNSVLRLNSLITNRKKNPKNKIKSFKVMKIHSDLANLTFVVVWSNVIDITWYHWKFHGLFFPKLSSSLKIKFLIFFVCEMSLEIGLCWYSKCSCPTLTEKYNEHLEIIIYIDLIQICFIKQALHIFCLKVARLFHREERFGTNVKL